MTPEELGHELLQYIEHPELSEQIKPYRDLFSEGLISALCAKTYDEQFRDVQYALKIANLTTEVAKIIDTPEAAGLAAWNVGNVYGAMNKYQDANNHFWEAEQFFESIKSLKRVAGLRINRAGNLCAMGQYDEALSLAKSARKICAEIGEEGDVYLGNLELTVGWVYEEIGEFEEALAAYDNGRSLFVKHDHPLQVALIDQNRAHLYMNLDSFEASERLFLSAREIFKKGNYLRELARVNLNLGELAYKTGHYQKALTRLNSAYDGFSDIPVPVEMAYVNIKRSNVYLQLNLINEMIQMADSAMQICLRQKMKREYVTCLINLGTGHLKLENYDQASHFFERARRNARQQNTPIRLMLIDINRAELAYKNKNPKRSKRILQRVLKSDNHLLIPNLEARIRLLLARCELMLNTPKLDFIEENLQITVEICQTYHLKQLLAETYVVLGDTAVYRQDYQSAGADYRQAVVEIKSLKAHFSIDELHIGYLDTQSEIYQKLLAVVNQLHLQTGDYLDELISAIDEAQMAAAPLQTQIESGQRERLSELQKTWNWYQNKLHDAKERSEAQKIESNLHHLETQLAEAHRQAQLHQDASIHTTAQSDLRPAKNQQMGDLQSCLDSKKGVIQFYETNQMLNAVVITKTETHWHPDIISLETLQRQSKAWQFFLNQSLNTDGNEKVALAHLQRFYQTVWQRLSRSIDSLPELFLSMPPNWYSLPINAFFDGSQFLIEQASLTYFSSLDRLLKSFTPSLKSTKAVIAGFSQNGRLPATIQEAKAVSKTLEASHEIHTLIEEKATIPTLQQIARQANILHLASHAIFRPDNPLFSWIQLADGRLTMADIYHWTFEKRPLIVLSACETGQGLPKGGGLMGLSRSLEAAGAGELILSRWRLEDNSSAQIMEKFYEIITHSKESFDTAVALQAAQKWAIKQNIPLFFWASFLYISN
ncbi:MAG: CHAT domain-containing tetratricopeptide repeat protein [Chloroflexota bacterium]